MNRLFALLFVVVLLIGGSLGALLLREKDEAVAQLAQNQQVNLKLESEAKSLRSEHDKLQAELKRLEQRLADANKTDEASGRVSALGSTSNDASNTSDALAKGLGAVGSMKGLAEMMKNPAMREIAKQQQVAMLDSQYAGLFAHLQLDDKEKANLKQLLADRLGIQTDMGLKMMDENLTPQQRQALVKEMTEATKTNDEKVRTFMNDDTDFATFKHWEETKRERMQLSLGQAAFASTGEPLSPVQERQLVDTMHAINARPSAVPDLNRPENFDPGKLTTEYFNKQMVRYDANAQAVLIEASKYLTPRQLEALKAMQAQQRAMQEAGMKMSSMMFGGQKK